MFKKIFILISSLFAAAKGSYGMAVEQVDLDSPKIYVVAAPSTDG